MLDPAAGPAGWEPRSGPPSGEGVLLADVAGGLRLARASPVPVDNWIASTQNSPPDYGQIYITPTYRCGLQLALERLAGLAACSGCCELKHIHQGQITANRDDMNMFSSFGSFA